MLRFTSKIQRRLIAKARSFPNILLGFAFSSLCLLTSCYSITIHCQAGAIQDLALSNTCIGMPPSQWKNKDLSNLQISTFTDRGFVQIYLEHIQTQFMGISYAENGVWIKFYGESYKEVVFFVEGTTDGVANGSVNGLPEGNVQYRDHNNMAVFPTGEFQKQLIGIVQDLSELYVFVQQHPDGESGISQNLATRINDLMGQRIWALYENPGIGT